MSQAKPVKVIAITAGKGGAGKSNIAVNLALALAQLKNKVMLLDADLGLGNVDIMMGLQTKYNLYHVIQGFCSLSDIIIPGPYGVRVIPSASGTELMAQLSPVEHAGIIDAFNELTDDLDYMIIDTAAGISNTVLSFTRSAQELIVVACDEPTSFADAYALIKVMYHRFEWNHFHIVANMIHTQKDGQKLFQKLCQVSEQFLYVQLDYLGGVPFDVHVHKAIKRQRPVLLEFPDSISATAIKELAENIENWNFKTSLGGNTSFFLDRLVAGEYRS